MFRTITVDVVLNPRLPISDADTTQDRLRAMVQNEKLEEQELRAAVDILLARAAERGGRAELLRQALGE